MPKPNFYGINEWKVLFCCGVALFLEDLTPSRLLCCQNVHFDNNVPASLKIWIFNYMFLFLRQN